MNKVLVITGSRGEYGYIRPLLKYAFSSESKLKCDVLVTNMHLLDKHGYSLKEFKNDNIPVKYKIENTLEGNTEIGMLKSLFLFGLSLTDILRNEHYDIILLAGDRGEQLISSITGFHLNIPIYHIQAGERSGHIDGMSRHAIARFTHIHLAANDDASNRLKQFGEEHFRIKNIGVPQIDELLSLETSDIKLSNSDMGIDDFDNYKDKLKSRGILSSTELAKILAWSHQNKPKLKLIGQRARRSAMLRFTPSTGAKILDKTFKKLNSDSQAISKRNIFF